MDEQSCTEIEAFGPREVVTIRQNELVLQAARLMWAEGVGCLAVVDDSGRLIGIVSERDIVKWVSKFESESLSKRVVDIMTSSAFTCPPGVTREQARFLMKANQIRHLPIVLDGMPVGMISIRDVLAE